MKSLVLIFYGLFISIILNAQYEVGDEGANVSIQINDIDNKNEIVSYNSSRRLIPASLTKIITTSAALQMLGPDYTYKTKFICKGNIIKGRLNGNLIIEAGGDPTLGSKYFDSTNPDSLFYQIVNWLHENGIREISGKVIIRSSAINYSSPRLWEDIGNYYGAYPHEFNWRDNTVIVTLSSSETGSLCNIISLEPSIEPYKLDCRVVAANHNKDSAYVYGLPEMDEWWIEGSIPSNRSSFKIKAAMPDPQKTFIKELTQYLEINHIKIGQETIAIHSSEDNMDTYIFESPKLSEIIKVVNHKSNNLFADMILLTLAKEFNNQYSWDLGVQVVTGFWNDRIDFKNNFRIKDGSGLTPKNLITTKGMVELLSWMRDNSEYFDVFKASLAIGGETGTLKSVFKHNGLKNRVFGKSGSMEGVLGYCGYFIDKQGNYNAFCYIANNYIIETKLVRKQMDSTLTQLILDH